MTNDKILYNRRLRLPRLVLIELGRFLAVNHILAEVPIRQALFIDPDKPPRRWQPTYDEPCRCTLRRTEIEALRAPERGDRPELRARIEAQKAPGRVLAGLLEALRATVRAMQMRLRPVRKEAVDAASFRR